MTKSLPGIQHLNTLWRVVNVAADLREVARDRRIYVFNTAGPITFYLRAEKADVRIVRWQFARVEVSLHLEVAFGWRVAAEQDENGVYVVAHRRRVIGELSSAVFAVAVPQDTHLVLKLEDGRVTLDDVAGLLEIAPPVPEKRPYLLPKGEEKR
jgi:hypothetical protein